jgi:6-phosphogluconate dehydrogenase
MQIGIVGLGRMGSNIGRRLLREGHECVVYNRSPAPVKELETEGAIGADSLEDLVEKLEPPRSVWVMIPAASTGQMVERLADLVEPGDIVIDGGNSYYGDDVDRADQLKRRGIHYLDAGTSGGVWGLDRGYCLMVGGESEAFRHLEPLLRSIAPGVEAASRTPGRHGEPSSAERGYLHCGPAGAGHFVKMVHNGVEYGIMAAYAEGLNVLRHADAGRHGQDQDAETAPLEHPEYYRYDFDIASVAEVWRRGSVVASWLLDLTAAALHESPDLSDFSGQVSDSGEGRWTAIAAIEEGVPAPVLASALSSRFSSRHLDHFSNQVLSAMRKQFGGHVEKASDETNSPA